MSSAPTMLETRDASGRGLRVEFVRRQDRYAHIIWLLDGETSVPAWESLEGTDVDDWPASPPLQQLSIETLTDGRRVALLVGMAGTSHWSLSVEANVDGTGFVFDVACRVKQEPEWLGSRYRQLGNSEGSGPVEFEGLSESTPESVSIRPTLLSNATFPRTQRWAYTVACGLGKE